MLFFTITPEEYELLPCVIYKRKIIFRGKKATLLRIVESINGNGWVRDDY